MRLHDVGLGLNILKLTVVETHVHSSVWVACGSMSQHSAALLCPVLWSDNMTYPIINHETMGH